MEMRRFGRTDLDVSRLTFGCGAVGGLMVKGAQQGPLGNYIGFTHCDDVREAISTLDEYGIAAGDAILVKGSNSVGLGALVTHFVGLDT